MDSRRDSAFDTHSAGITVRRALELPGLRSGLPEVLAGGDRPARHTGAMLWLNRNTLSGS